MNFLLALLFAAAPHHPATHRLPATPATVAYGYYWSEAKPALRIASSDVIDVDTLLTNTPQGLQRAGVPPEKIQESLKVIVNDVTGDRKGPGGHILTGPVYVEGAEPGDVLEVKILSIDFPIDYGYNGCSGIVPENCDRSLPAKIIPLDRKRRTAQFAPGIVIPLAPFFGSMGVAPAPELGVSAAIRPGGMPAISTIASSSPGRRSTSRCSSAARSSKSATDTPRKATAKSIRPPSRPRCADGCS